MTAVGVEVVKSGNPASGINIAADGSVSIVVLSKRVIRANADYSIEYGLESGTTFTYTGAAQGASSGVGDTATMVLVKGLNNAAGALDIYASAATTQGEFLVRMYNQGDVPSTTSVPATYFNGSAAFYTRSYVVVSGTFTGTGINARIVPPTLDPLMVGIHADVADALVLRANLTGNRNLRGMNAAGTADTLYLTDTGTLSLGLDLAGTNKKISLAPTSVSVAINSIASTDIPLFRLTTVDPYVLETGVGSSAAAGTFAGIGVATRSYNYSTAIGHLYVLSTDGAFEWQQNGARVWQMYQKVLYCLGTTGYIDLSAISAGNPNFKITKTSDTPVTTYTAHVASTDPAGYIEILEGANVRYIPFYT